MEKGIDFREVVYPGITDKLRDLEWDMFVQFPEVGIVSIVREFYTNAPMDRNQKIMACGDKVLFIQSTINYTFS